MKSQIKKTIIHLTLVSPGNNINFNNLKKIKQINNLNKINLYIK